MRRLTRKSLDELAMTLPVIDEIIPDYAEPQLADGVLTSARRGFKGKRKTIT